MTDRDSPAAIHITATAREKIRVNLVGKIYLVTPPKTAFAMDLGLAAVSADVESAKEMFTSLNDWIDDAFGEANGAKVKARLRDKKDQLDIPHVMELMHALIEKTSGGNPTSSS